ncbi:MAG: diaminopimelate decarboxylase [Lachnospiraceae bacterium]|nr:diaminopimelate decarboxylase [Lachnospiraceae bacterium]
MDKQKMAVEAEKRLTTPAYVFDLDRFHRRFQYLKENLGENMNVNYCMKTNPFLTRESLMDTDRIEVCSYGEFLICKELKIDPKRLLISGVLKKPEDMREIFQYCKDEAIYTAESPGQARVLQMVAKENHLFVNVYYRLHCGQFGMDENTIIELLGSEDYPNLLFYGIHYFTGTQKHKISKHAKEIKKLDEFFERIKGETGKEVLHLEYGTGFGVPYFANQEETITNPEGLREFRQLLMAMKWKGKISLEMGRAIAYDCGYYIVKAMDIKETAGKNIIICDGGIHQMNYDGQLRGMYKPHITVVRKKQRLSEKKNYAIYGSLCTTNDVLVSEFASEEISEGDMIVFERVGAYSVYEGMSLFLSHELPGIGFYSEEDGFVVVRKQQESYRINTPIYE